ncbi:MAG: hypothetical protein WEB06_21050 [Actinomycetota bacterium]
MSRKVVALLVAVFIAGAALRGPGASAAEEGLQPVGKLPLPKKAELILGTHEVFYVDEPARRMYLKYPAYDGMTDFRGDPILSFRVAEYDLTSTTPSIRRDVHLFSSEQMNPINSLSPYSVAVERKRNRLLMLNSNCNPCPEGDAPSPARVEIVDLATMTPIGGYDLLRQVPGVQLYGMTYSPEDDRLYFVGETNPIPGGGVQDNNPSGAIPATGTVAVALEAATGEVAWVRPVPECQIPLATKNVGALIARSTRASQLYFACIRPFVYPGESGIVRMTIAPDAGRTDALNFPVEYFPISGTYTKSLIDGISAFDYRTDRFFMQSLSTTTPGSWVFDGRLSAWAGFVGAPDSSNEWLGFDQTNGRYYMGGNPAGEPGYILSVDGRAIPVPQGRVAEVSPVGGFIHVDAPTRRLFFKVAGHDDIVIYRDTSRIAPAPEPLDYDVLTADIPEGPHTLTTFAGSVNGFGARMIFVGGTGGIVNNDICAQVGGFSEGNVCDDIRGALKQVFNVSPSTGDRDLLVAWVPSADIRNVGVASASQALTFDQTTDGEYHAIVKSMADRLRGEEDAGSSEDGSVGDQAADELEARLQWPHRPVLCLDSGERSEPDPAAGPGGSAKASCDLSKAEAESSAEFGFVSMEGVSIGRATFETRMVKDPRAGVLTETTSIVRGIELSSPGGSVVIKRVAARAVTAARGRTGTAKVSWERFVEGVVVKDAAGAVVFECAAGKECDQQVAVAAINDVLKTRIRVFLPDAELVATPKGAFASVQEAAGNALNDSVVNNDTSAAAPALEIVVYNDTSDKSRLVFQLAAIQASSIYGITGLPDDLPLDGGDGALPTVVVQPGITLPGEIRYVTVPAQSAGGSRLAQAAVFFIRSPKDAFLLGLMILIFVGAVAAASRRSALMSQIGQGG